MLQSKQFWGSIRFTLFFTLAAVSLELALGMMLALSTYWVWGRLTGVLRAIIIPWAIPQIIQASIWRWMYNTDVGLIGDLLVRIGLTETLPLFLSNPSLARWAVIVANVWKGASVAAIFLMGGLALVPKELTDAAKVDGARVWRRFWTITVPMIMPTILVTLLFRTMAGLQVFDIIYGLTNGGPGTTTETLSSFSYKYYFRVRSVRPGLGLRGSDVPARADREHPLYPSRAAHFRFKGLGS